MYDATGLTKNVSIEAGTRDALVFVLLHEATHVVDSVLGITPAGDRPTTPFVRDIWQGRIKPASRFQNPLRESIRFRPGGKVLSINEAEAAYSSLRQTPFVSLYGSSNWSDDLAEYVAVYDWTQVLKQPYRIVIRQEGKELFAYEPMQSDLVRVRIGQMKRFYEAGS